MGLLLHTYRVVNMASISLLRDRANTGITSKVKKKKKNNGTPVATLSKVVVTSIEAGLPEGTQHVEERRRYMFSG